MNLPGNLKWVADAVEKSYRVDGKPVIIRSKEDEVLHGQQTIEMAAGIGVGLNAKAILNIDRSEFEASDLPEFCEAERQAWLTAKFPGGTTQVQPKPKSSRK